MSEQKRGRKRTMDLYFGPQEELAVTKYLESTDPEEKNRIYNQSLRKAFDKLTESIIRRYKLYVANETFEDMHTDCLSFLITKVDRYNPELGFKAYSYYGTTIKRYMINLIKKYNKNRNRVIPYEDISSKLEESKELSYTIEEDFNYMPEFILDLRESLEKEITDENTSKKKLSENERKLGLALIEILKTWRVTFDNMAGGTKFNKITILETIRNYTGLTTKDIRIAMKRFKDLYEILKHS